MYLCSIDKSVLNWGGGKCKSDQENEGKTRDVGSGEFAGHPGKSGKHKKKVAGTLRSVK